jgi:Xaa-Pro aminopeptidase
VARYFATTQYADRLSRARQQCAELALDAIVIGPGPDLRYLTGYHATVLERLTALVVPAVGDLTLVVPNMEVGTVYASPINELDIELATWDELDDPYSLVRDCLPHVERIAVDDLMWAVKALRLREAMPDVTQLTAGPVMSELRMRKSPAEIAELVRAGRAVDRVHERVADLLTPGRTEREVAKDIAELLTEEHESADFVIVAAGPNSAVPHHEPSEAIIAVGDIVVVDIGGTTDVGYCSDSTRTYSIGKPDADFANDYQALHDAQQLARAAVAVGVTCGEVDAAARDSLSAAGLGKYFSHRTGHGIGLETHEEPYILAGNDRQLEEGMAFSIEPGFYRPGRAGARLEDIVVCTSAETVVCNNRPRELAIVD